MISLASAFISYTQKTQDLDWLLYDNAMRFSQLQAENDIVMIEIDDKSLSQIGRWPWARNVHAQLLEKLTTAEAKIVVFDVLFPELDTKNTLSDLQFSKAIKHHRKVILPIYIETLGQQGQVVENPPHGLFYREVAGLGHVHLQTETDGVVRGVFLKEGVGTAFWPHLSLATLQNLGDTSESLGIDTLPGRRADDFSSQGHSVGIARDYYNLIPMPAADQGLRHYSYADIVKGVVDTKLLRNKIIFIGATAAGLGDVLATPIGSMNGVELNAWIFQALRTSQMIQILPEKQLALTTFLTVLCLVFMLGRLSPRLFLIFSILSIGSVLSLSVLLLLFGKTWIPTASIMLGLMAFYPLWSWLRAETILRFLKEEIDTLSLSNLNKKDPRHRELVAQKFLAEIGVIDTKTCDQTHKGKDIAKAFQEDGQEIEFNFWPKQLAKHDDRHPELQTKYKGVEIVARTIAQLDAIKKNDRKNRQLIEKSLSSLQDAVCIADLCGEITFTNHCFKDWFQTTKSSDDLLNILKQLELKSGKSWAQVLCKLYETHQLFTSEAVLKTQHNKQFLCQASLVSINEAYNDTVILTFTDISQLKAAENARSEALSFLSHDLRSPMVSVLAILERYHGNKDTISETTIHHIEALVRKNLDYAESFLQLSKADALTDMNMHPCDLHAVLDAAQVQAMALAESKSISVVTERCDEDVWVLGDIALLERALTNLISNAIKFSPVDSKLTLALNKNGKTAQLTVSDQGIGINLQEQSTIFDRFTRSKSTESIEGAGLGLNFVATVVHKHQGRIELSSELGKGATFTLHLPVLSEEEIFESDG